MVELVEKLSEEKSYLEQLSYFIESASNMVGLSNVASEIEPEVKVQIDKKASYLPEEIKSENCTIFIGKNNKQNDYIVSKLAKDDDIWFHTKDCAGSHVLLRVDNASDDLILKCAKLAKQYSKGSLSSKVGVIYTFAKYLKKPPKANLGYVTYSNEKEIIVD